MPTVTWLGSHAGSAPVVEQFGYELEINVPVEVEDKQALGKFWRNKFYRVDGYTPKDSSGEQPIRDKELVKAQPRRVVQSPRKSESPTQIEIEELPPEIVDINEVETIQDNSEDMPNVVKSQAQVIDLDGDGEPDAVIAPIAEEPTEEEVPQPTPRRRQRRRRN